MSFSHFFTFSLLLCLLLLLRLIERKRKRIGLTYTCAFHRHNLIADHSADHSYYTYVISFLFVFFSKKKYLCEETVN